MFCPNCGHDCGEDRFCSQCGRELQANAAEQTFEDRKKQLQGEGVVYCPKCLSTSVIEKEKEYNYGGYPFYSTSAKAISLFGMLWKAGKKEAYGNLCICQKCKHKWYTKRGELQAKYEEYVSKILGECTKVNIAGIDGAYLQLTKDQVILHLSEKKGCIIPYDELAIVEHRESMGVFYGRLSIRDIVHMKKPFPKSYKAAKKERFTIMYAPEYLEGYRMVAAALKSIAEENRKAGLI